MNGRWKSQVLLAVTMFTLSARWASELIGQTAPPPSGWGRNDMNRPRPPVVTPPPQSLPAPAPADALVLFDGRDMSRWELVRGGPVDWKVENGYVEVVNGPGVIRPAFPGTGAIRTKEQFGDIQLHLEWAAPNPPEGVAQDRGNSGVMLMGRYELQVLDSYQREDTYADGQAGAIYGQYPPLANATRPPGEWQSYDVVFRAPRYAPDGAISEAARITVIHNGIVIQNNEMLRTGGGNPQNPPSPITTGPLQLQDHNRPVRYRNIWIRRLADRPEPPV
jgi:hypothetical protein